MHPPSRRQRGCDHVRSRANLTRVALPSIPGATPTPFARVFKVAITAGILACCFSFVPNALWLGFYTRTIAANFLDGILYDAITGAILAWRWPH